MQPDLPVVDPDTGLVDPDEVIVVTQRLRLDEALVNVADDVTSWRVNSQRSVAGLPEVFTFTNSPLPELEGDYIRMETHRKRLAEVEAERDEARRQFVRVVRERDSLARRCALRYEETVNLREQIEYLRSAYEGLVTAARAWLARWTPAGVRAMQPTSANADLVRAIQALPSTPDAPTAAHSTPQTDVQPPVVAESGSVPLTPMEGT